MIEEVDTKGAKKAVLESVSWDIKIKRSDRRMVIKSPRKPEIKLKGEEIRIIVKSSKTELPFFNVFNVSVEESEEGLLEVEIPSSILFLEINTVSGDATCEGLSLKNIKSVSVSGGIEIDKISSREAFFRTLSGDIGINSSEIDKIVLSSVSGDVKIKHSFGREWDITTTSGDIELIFPGYPNARILPRTMRGDIVTSLPYILEGKEYVFGEGKLRISVKSASGDLSLRSETSENEYVKRILRMLYEGKISKEEAERLIKELRF